MLADTKKSQDEVISVQASNTVEEHEKDNIEQSIHEDAQSDQDSQLSDSHRQFLMERYGTVDLVPLPSEDLNDPLNWPAWKKNLNLIGVSLQAMASVFMCSAPLPAMTLIAQYFNTDFERVSYFAFIPNIFLGLSTLAWKPVANRYGRRPVWIVSCISSGLLQLGAACCKSYGVMTTMRVLSGISHSPALVIGGATIAETFFSHERARKVGIWSLAFTVGPSLGPLLASFAVYHTGNWRWSYWVIVILCFFNLVFALFFCPETLYVRQGSTSSSATKQSAFADQYLKIRRRNKAPFNLYEFVEPFIWGLYLPVFTAYVAHGICNSMANPGINIILPKEYKEVYGFNVQQVGLQYLSMMVGLVLGEQIGGPLSDLFMKKGRLLSKSRSTSAELRLWAAYLGAAIAITGVLVYTIMLSKAEHHHWTIVPNIGIALAGVGNQIVAIVAITYAIDKMGAPNAGTVSSAINQYRQIWGFVAPFFFNPMYDNLGLVRAGGLMSGIIAIAMLPVIYMQTYGRHKVYTVLSSDAKKVAVEL